MTQAQVVSRAGAKSPGTLSDALPEAVVAGWVDAFNQRDLAGMLACLAGGIAFHPLRIGGLKASYHGHDGVREWFVQLQSRHHEHRIVLSEIRSVEANRVFASGALSLPGGEELSSFCGLHRFAAGQIVAMHHYLSDPDVIEQLGLIP